MSAADGDSIELRPIVSSVHSRCAWKDLVRRGQGDDKANSISEKPAQHDKPDDPPYEGGEDERPRAPPRQGDVSPESESIDVAPEKRALDAD